MEKRTVRDYADMARTESLVVADPGTRRRYTAWASFLGQIPHFPAFKPLEVSDQFAIEIWVKRFLPYSDFNFVSLWSWNIEGDIAVAWLNDNLVVKFKDYGSPARFFSFLGITDVARTALTLLRTAHAQGIEPRLHMIPEAVIVNSPGLDDWLRVAAERSQDDYVLSTEEWSTLAGGKFRKKRNAVHHFERTCAPEFRPIDISRTSVQQEIQAVFGQWTVQRGCAGQPSAVVQSVALRRVFSLERPGDLLSYGVFIDGEMRA